MDIDSAFDQVGHFGKVQKLYFVLIGVIQAYGALVLVHLVFAAEKPSHFTCIDGNGSVHQSVCPSNDVSRCVNIIYPYEVNSSSRTIIQEWNLVCSESFKVQLVQSLFMAGVLIGAPIFGQLSDSYGRMKCLMISMFLQAAFSFTSSFATSYSSYLVQRFLTGVFNQGATLCSYVLLSELIGSSARSFCCTCIQAFYPLGIMLVSIAAFLWPAWRMSSAYLSAFGFITLFYYLLIPESPRWLLQKNRKSDATYVFKCIASSNKRVLNDNFEVENIRHQSKSTESLLSILKYSVILKWTLLQMFAWFVSSAVYLGLTFAAGSLGDIYVSTALLAIVEIPAYYLQNMLIDSIGRRLLLSSFMTLAGIACIAIQILPADWFSLILVFALVGKLMIAGAYGVVYVYSCELFPTSIRNSGMGLTSVAARFGGVLCPFIIRMGDWIPGLQFTILGTMAITCGILSKSLPETKGRPLPETLNDLIDKPIKN